MRQNLKGKRVLFVLIPLVVFLCCLPAVSHAAQPLGELPRATDSCEVPSGTSVEGLRTIFQLTSDLSLTVLGADGSIRSSGILETGDRAVIKSSSGVLDCVLIAVQGQPVPSSSQASSGESSGAPQADSSGSTQAVSSAASRPVSSASPTPSSSKTGASSSSQAAKEAVFGEPVNAASVAGLFAEEADWAVVLAPDGSERKSGLLCTGDRIILQDESGNAFRTMTVTVLGDLTRCGRPTESGCTLLYRYLTGNVSLPADLSVAADMDRDGRVDTADLLRMKLKLLEHSPDSRG